MPFFTHFVLSFFICFSFLTAFSQTSPNLDLTMKYAEAEFNLAMTSYSLDEARRNQEKFIKIGKNFYDIPTVEKYQDSLREIVKQNREEGWHDKAYLSELVYISDLTKELEDSIESFFKKNLKELDFLIKHGGQNIYTTPQEDLISDEATFYIASQKSLSLLRTRIAMLYYRISNLAEYYQNKPESRIVETLKHQMNRVLIRASLPRYLQTKEGFFSSKRPTSLFVPEIIPDQFLREYFFTDFATDEHGSSKTSKMVPTSLRKFLTKKNTPLEELYFDFFNAQQRTAEIIDLYNGLAQIANQAETGHIDVGDFTVYRNGYHFKPRFSAEESFFYFRLLNNIAVTEGLSPDIINAEVQHFQDTKFLAPELVVQKKNKIKIEGVTETQPGVYRISVISCQSLFL